MAGKRDPGALSWNDFMSRVMRVFHVEDDEDDVLLIKRTVVRANIPLSIEVAASGDQAVNYLERIATGQPREQRPDLILLDIKVPNVGGFELLRRIRANDTLRNIPVVMLSGSSEPSDISAARELGANAYMVKPADPTELRTFLQALYATFQQSELPSFWPPQSVDHRRRGGISSCN